MLKDQLDSGRLAAAPVSKSPTDSAATADSDLPLPKTLCKPSHAKPQEDSDEEEKPMSYSDKKTFWEKKSSSESLSSVGSSQEAHVVKRSPSAQMTEIPEERAGKPKAIQESSFESSSYSRGVSVDSTSTSASAAKAPSASESFERQLSLSASVASSEMSGVRAVTDERNLVIQSIVPTELSQEEILQQISPEKKEHFDTFVKPELEESHEQHLEEKTIPLSKEEVSIDKEKLVTMQIREGIVESELDQDEGAVMSSESLIRTEQFAVVQEMEPTFQPAETLQPSRVEVTLDKEDEGSSELTAFEKHMGKVEENVVDFNGSTQQTIDPLAGQLDVSDLHQARRLSREEAHEIAEEFLSTLAPEAVGRAQEMTGSQDDLDDFEEAKKTAQGFIEQLEQEAIERAERISPLRKSQEDILDLSSREQQKPEKRVSIQVSSEISDSDLRAAADLSEMREELDIQISQMETDAVAIGRSFSDVDHAMESQLLLGSDFRFVSSYRSHFVHALHGEQDDLEEMRLASGHAVSGDGDDAPGVQRSLSGGTADDKSQSGEQSFLVEGTSQSSTTSRPMIMSTNSEDIWAEEARVALRRDVPSHAKRSDNESSSSVSKAQKDLNRRSGTDIEASGFSSSGENYMTAEGNTTSQSGISRPSSSDVEAMYSAMSGRSSTLTTTEYETAHSSRDISTHSNVTLTSDEYHTAVSSMTSKDSLKSIDTSESSGNLGSIEISEGMTTEADSLLDVILEQDRDLITPTGAPNEEIAQATLVSSSPRLPGSVVLAESTDTETDDGNKSPAIQPNMKRSAEMMFQTHAIVGQETDEESVANVPLKHLSESRETLSASVATISSGSDATVIGAGDKRPIQEESESKVQRTEVFDAPKPMRTDSTTSSVSEQAVHSGQMGSADLLSSIEELKKDESPVADRDQVRFVSFESTVSFDTQHAELRGQKSFDSEFGSRPESELKNLESRPQSISEAMLSRSSSEDPRPSSKEDVSDSEVTFLKAHEEPFVRPLSPEPPREGKEFPDNRQQIVQQISVVEQTTEDFMSHEAAMVPEVEIMQAIETGEGETAEDLVIGSPPVTKPLGVKYWPPSDDLNQEADSSLPVEKSGAKGSESEDTSEAGSSSMQEMYEKEVEEKKKWLETQFEGQVIAPDEADYFYSQPLDQIAEEDEQELEKLKQSLSNAPEFEMGARKKQYAVRSDDISMTSLQEFEKLEEKLAGSRGSMGSQDSLEGPIKSAVKKPLKGTGDDVSMDSFASLQEFERLEKACKDVATIEKIAKEQEDVLSEIEEGHESQYSESTDTAETLSEARSVDDNSDDFEERMFQIDEIIKQAQTNVEQFHTEEKATRAEMLPLEDIMGRPDSRTESTGIDRTASAGTPESDSLEAPVPELPKEPVAGPSHKWTYSQAQVQEVADVMQSSIDSLELNKKADIMQTSADSLELKVATGDVMVISTDSIEDDKRAKEAIMTASIDSLEGHKSVPIPMEISATSLGPKVQAAINPGMIASTDSLEESCSTNTRATGSMMSSAASGTLVADLEHDNTRVPMHEAKKFLIQQGEIPIEDSDDSISSKDTMDVTHSQVSFGHNVTEVIRADNETSHVIERTIEMPADVSRVKFSGPHAEEKMREYMSQFKSGEDIQETEYVDEKGNIVQKKVIQQRVTVEKATTKQVTIDDNTKEAIGESCEETFEELDEHGNKKRYTIKRTLEPVVQGTKTIEVIAERRQAQGLATEAEPDIFCKPDPVPSAEPAAAVRGHSKPPVAPRPSVTTRRGITGIFGCKQCEPNSFPFDFCVCKQQNFFV